MGGPRKAEEEEEREPFGSSEAEPEKRREEKNEEGDGGAEGRAECEGEREQRASEYVVGNVVIEGRSLGSVRAISAESGPFPDPRSRLDRLALCQQLTALVMLPLTPSFILNPLSPSIPRVLAASAWLHARLAPPRLAPVSSIATRWPPRKRHRKPVRPRKLLEAPHRHRSLIGGNI